MLVLECVPIALAEEITKALNIPVIGIGAGVQCDGQVLVLHDMLGISAHAPKFSKNFMVDGATIPQAIKAYNDTVKQGTFPAAEHWFV
jgi:3-methyl-2-oxobutanoate hydroxymethyltransferase